MNSMSRIYASDSDEFWMRVNKPIKDVTDDVEQANPPAARISYLVPPSTY
jgi:hypothetical protein